MRHLALPLVAFLASCGSVSPPSTPPDYSPPPPLATEGLMPVVVTAELPFDVAGSRAYAERTPILQFFAQSGTIAPPVDGEILQGTWGEPGAVRRLKLADGHYVIERIIKNQPEEFVYQIWVFTNEAGRGVEQIVGIQTYTPIGEDRTAFEWTYAVKPKNAITRIFIGRQLGELEAFLQQAVDGWAANAEQEVSAAAAQERR